MQNEEWTALVEQVLRTLGEISPGDINTAKFTVIADNKLAAASDEPPKPNDGRPKIFSLVVTTRG